MAEVLKVPLIVDAQGEAEVKGLDDAVKDFEKTADRAASKAQDFGRKTKQELSGSVVDLSGKLRGQANVALTDFNRIVQDAPFGLVAVQNNITQLVDSFGRLAATQGAAGALKQMGAALAGPAGLVALVSLATSAFLVFGQKAKETVAEVNKELEQTKKAIDDIVEVKKDPLALLIGSEEEARAALARIDGLVAGYQKSIEAMRESGGGIDGSEIFAMQNIENQLEILTPLRDRVAEVVEEYDLLQRVFDVASLVIPPEVEAGVESYRASIENVSIALHDLVKLQSEGIDVQLRGRYANEAVLSDLKMQKEAAEKATEAEYARQEAIKRSIESSIAAANRSIKTARDAAAAVVDAIRQEIQAYIAKSIAAQLAALGPLAFVVGAAVGAATNLLFNNLIPDFSGGSGGGSSAYVRPAQPRPSIGAKQRISPTGIGFSGEANSALVNELRLTRAAFESKVFTVKGMDLETVSNRTASLRKQAGQP